MSLIHFQFVNLFLSAQPYSVDVGSVTVVKIRSLVIDVGAGRQKSISTGPEQSGRLVVRLLRSLLFWRPGFDSRCQSYLKFSYRLSSPGPWWWFSGQRSRLLLQRSKFEFCWLLLYGTARKDENKRKEAGNGPFFKKVYKPIAVVASCITYALSTTPAENINIFLNTHCLIEMMIFVNVSNIKAM